MYKKKINTSYEMSVYWINNKGKYEQTNKKNEAKEKETSNNDVNNDDDDFYVNDGNRKD